MYIFMDVDLIFKIAAIGIIVAVLHQLLVRSGREESGATVTQTCPPGRLYLMALSHRL